MGLHVSSVAQVANAAPELHGIKYFLYLLDYYQFADGVMEEVVAELPVLEAHFARLGSAVIITSVRNMDFASDVLSWHQIVGKDPSQICPAILITTLSPGYFVEKSSASNDSVSYTDKEFDVSTSIKAPWIILELGKLCNSKQDVVKILRSIISDISEGRPLSDFQYTGAHEFENRPIVSGKLEYHGVQFDIRAAIAKAMKWFAGRSF